MDLLFNCMLSNPQGSTVSPQISIPNLQAINKYESKKKHDTRFGNEVENQIRTSLMEKQLWEPNLYKIH